VSFQRASYRLSYHVPDLGIDTTDQFFVEFIDVIDKLEQAVGTEHESVSHHIPGLCPQTRQIHLDQSIMFAYGHRRLAMATW